MALIREIVPSMFHRRLLLLMVLVLLLVSGVMAQLIRLAVFEGEKHLTEAESVLSTRKLLPTVRGRIYDIKGRVIAEDAPSEDIEVDYDVVTGEWAYRQARRDAYREHRDDWGRLSFENREQLIAKAQTPYNQKIEQLWTMICDVGQISRDELEQRRAAIIRHIQAVRSEVWDRRSQRRAAEQGEGVTLREAAIRIREENQSHPILKAVDANVALAFRKREGELPGLTVVPSKRREYPLGRAVVGVTFDTMVSPLRSNKRIEVDVEHLGDRIIGAMRNVWAEDVDEQQGGRPYRRGDGTIDLAGYLPGDRIGLRGIEYSQERRLRGTRGVIIRNLETNETQRTPPVPGDDVQLTLDMHLQARIQALLDPSVGLMRVQPWHRNDDLPIGTPLNGSVVVMSVETGHVLALVSSPAGPDEDLDDGHWPDEYDQPMVNRAVSALYPPGSTLKPIVYAIAASKGAIQHDQHYACMGHLYPDKPNSFRCWGWRPAQGKFHTHGSIGPASAIAQSCNVYFYSCGRALGPRRLIEGLHEFGYGQDPDLGLPDELPGILPELEGPNVAGRGLNERNAILMGIGQGPIAATPVQVAAAHAALARGGVYLSPILLTHRQPAQRVVDLNIPRRVIENTLQGLYDSANASFGTGHHITLQTGREPLMPFDDLTIRSKTGTAQAPTLFDDVNENGRYDEGDLMIRAGSHSWYVAHVQRKGESQAAYIVVVLVEYGGSGGKVAGPITSQVIRAIQAEGHL